MTRLSDTARARLTILAEDISGRGGRFFMGDWVQSVGTLRLTESVKALRGLPIFQRPWDVCPRPAADVTQPPKTPACNTAACIGGTAVMLFDQEAVGFVSDDGSSAGSYQLANGRVRAISDAARELLDLPNMYLFHVGSWPVKFLAWIYHATGQTFDPAWSAVDVLTKAVAIGDTFHSATFDMLPAATRTRIAVAVIEDYLATDGWSAMSVAFEDVDPDLADLTDEGIRSVVPSYVAELGGPSYIVPDPSWLTKE